MTNSQPASWYRLINRIHYLMEHPDGHTKEISALRRGSSPMTEHYAYPYVLPYTQELKTVEQKTALLQVAAAIVEYRDIPAFSSENGVGYRSFGSWCYHLSKHLADGKQTVLDPDNPDAVGQRLAYLHTQTTEETVLSIRRLLALANNLKNPPALNKYDLAKTIINWGNGISPASQRTRRQVLRDYYSSFNHTLSATADEQENVD